MKSKLAASTGCGRPRIGRARHRLGRLAIDIAKEIITRYKM